MELSRKRVNRKLISHLYATVPFYFFILSCSVWESKGANQTWHGRGGSSQVSMQTQIKPFENGVSCCLMNADPLRKRLRAEVWTSFRPERLSER